VLLLLLSLLISLRVLCAAVLLADENDQRPYDPFGDDDDVMSSAPVIPATRTVTTAASTTAASTPATTPATVSINKLQVVKVI